MEFYAVLLAAGALIGLVSFRIRAIDKRAGVGYAPAVAMLVGVAVGPHGIFFASPPHQWSGLPRILEELAHVSLAATVIGIVLCLPADYFARQWRTIALLVGVVLPAMIGAVTVLVYTTLGLPFAVALLLGTVLAPVDPLAVRHVVDHRFVQRRLPARLREALLAESAAGTAIFPPFVAVTIFFANADLMASASTVTTPSVIEFLAWAVGWNLWGGVAIGVVVGLTGAALLNRGVRRIEASPPPIFAVVVAVVLVVVGLANVMGANALLAAAVAGVALALTTDAADRGQDERMHEIFRDCLGLLVFLLFGVALPWGEWGRLPWGAVVLVGVIFSFAMLRRLPAVWFSRRLNPALVARSEALFFGFYGPIGAATIFFALTVTRQTGYEIVWTLASLLVAASLMIHALTTTPAVRGLARRLA